MSSSPAAAPLPAATGSGGASAGGGDTAAAAAAAPGADDAQQCDDDATKLPPGYASTSQRLIRVAGPLPADRQTQVALDENVIADHLERFLEAEDNAAGTKVFSAILGGIHVYCFPPSQQLGRSHWTICTMGVSGTRMSVPDDIEDGEEWARCELLCYLPGDWPLPAALGVGDGSTAENWPFEMLRDIGTYITRTGAWVSDMHGIPNLASAPPGQPFHASTKLSHVILLEPMEAEGFVRVDVGGTPVRLLMVVPLTSAEAQWKRNVGARNSIFHVLGDKENYEDIQIGYTIEAGRPCCVEDLHCDREIATRLAQAEGSGFEGDGDSGKGEEEEAADDDAGCKA